MRYRVLLFPFALIYALAAGLRNLMFRSGVLRQHRFGLPIILVGNLNVGGSGKTPHVEYLINLLRPNHRVATLSRGYGRKSKGFVMAGKGCDAELIGDEPMQYFSKFNDITVSVCEDRVTGVRRLLDSERKPDVVIMDDGFQHRKINPGMKILLTPFHLPFTRDFVLPAGDLREARSGYRRADVIVVTKADPHLPDAIKQKFIREIKPAAHQKIFFSSVIYNDPMSFYSYETISPESLKNSSVLIFTGVAHPESLTKYLKHHAAEVQTARFSDHHDYTEKDIKALLKKFDKFAGKSAVILTTEKDYQRLKGSELFREFSKLPCYYIPVQVKIDREEEFNTLIKTYVEQNKGSH